MVTPGHERAMVGLVNFAENRPQSHRNARLRPARAGERPQLPLRPVATGSPEPLELGLAPGSAIRIETSYLEGGPGHPSARRSGRVLYDAVERALGWAPGLALEVTLGPGHWVSFSSAGRPRQPSSPAWPISTGPGASSSPSGCAPTSTPCAGEEVLVCADAVDGALRVADVSLLTRALGLLHRVEAAARQPACKKKAESWLE